MYIDSIKNTLICTKVNSSKDSNKNINLTNASKYR